MAAESPEMIIDKTKVNCDFGILFAPVDSNAVDLIVFRDLSFASNIYLKLDFENKPLPKTSQGHYSLFQFV